MENSINAIYCDPNAFVNKQSKEPPKKVVFQEPYDCLPKFYIDNKFTKHGCECVPTHKTKSNTNNLNTNSSPPAFSGFDFKKMLPIFANLLNKNSSGLSGIVSLLSGSKSGNLNNEPLTDALQNLLGSGGMDIGKLLGLFSGGTSGNKKGLFDLFNKPNKTKKEIKSTDFEINNYTRVN